MPSSTLTLLVFDVADVRCGLSTTAVGEVLPTARLERPPGCPPALAGFLTLGGRPVPVVALARVLGLEPTPADRLYGHVILLRDGGAGLLVERADDVVTVDRARLAPVGDGRDLSKCVAGTVVSVGRLVHVLDADRLFEARERAVVADVAAREAARRALFAADAT